MNENIRFKATTCYDEEAYNVLTYLMIHKLRKWPRIMLIIVGLLTALGSGVLMLYTGTLSAFGMLLMMLGSAMCFFGVLAQRFAVKIMMAGSKKGETPQNTYLLMENCLRVQSGEIQKDYAYSSLRRVLEMSGYLFLFTDDGQLYLLALKDVKDSVKEFRAFLEERITQARQAKG